MTTEESLYEIESDRLDKELNPYLTDEFLNTLVMAARTCGWSIDHTETTKFVQWCYDIAGLEQPSDEDLEPYQSP